VITVNLFTFLWTSPKTTEKREKEHKKERKRFSSMKVIKPPVTEASAEKWEEKRLDTYRYNHGGKNPRYNKTNK